MYTVRMVFKLVKGLALRTLYAKYEAADVKGLATCSV